MDFFERLSTIDTFVVFLVAVLVSLIIKYYFEKRRIFLMGRKLPGPKGVPILGNALEFLDCDYDIMPKINEYHKTYDLFALWIGHQLSVFVRSPEDAEIYCNSYKLMHRGEKMKYFNDFMGKGLLFSGGDEWVKAKRVMHTAFPYSTLQRFVSVIQNETKILMDRLKKEEGNKTFFIYSYLRDCAFDIINNGAFQLDISAQKTELEVIKAAEKIKSLAVKRIYTPWHKSNTVYKYFEDGKMFYQSLDVIDRFFYYFIEKRKKEEEKRVAQNDDKNKGDRLFWEKLAANEDLSIEEIKHHSYTTLITGFETTANAICFILTMLALYPNVQEKTYKELISVINQGEFDYRKLYKLEYLERVINETLRLFPTVPMNMRNCTEDIQFGKYLIPAGSDIHLNFMALHRDPAQFENPNKFNPDNFLPEVVAKRHPYAFIPFSMGPRKCIGAKFAMMSMKIIVGTILMNYKVECDYKSMDEIPFRNEVTIKMTNDCPIRLLKR